MARTQAGILLIPRAAGDDVIRLADVTTLGRSEACTVVVPLPTVSRLHARIELQHDRYVISDVESANGTFLNGELLAESRALSTGDTIWLGSPEAPLHFSDPEETMPVPIQAAPPALTIDTHARAVAVYGVPTPLSPLEYGLLHYLAQHPGTVCTREACFQHVWGQPYDHATCEDALNACVAKLRRNLRATVTGTGREPPQITTIQRVGFRLDTEVSFAPPPLRERAVG